MDDDLITRAITEDNAAAADYREWRARRDEQQRQHNREMEAAREQYRVREWIKTTKTVEQSSAASNDDGWNTWLRASLDVERKFIFDVIARAMAEERSRRRDELEKRLKGLKAVEDRLTSLQDQLDELRARLESDNGDKARVITLPKISLRGGARETA